MTYYPNGNHNEPNPNYIPPASVKKGSLIRISEGDDWIVDYDRERGMYRVSYFEDGHFKDECWFDCYEEKECREHGHWILRIENNVCDMTYQYECSKCTQPSRYATNFCHNCGIIMDEEIERA